METYIIIAVITILFLVALKNILFTSVTHVDLEMEIDPEKDSSKDSEEVTVIREFTPRQLSNFNGFDLEKIYIAVKGNVYDVSKGRSFYGPSGPYSNFAGNDASRGLALNSFESELIRSWDEPIDDLSGLTDADLKSLDNWENMFKGKYPCVGTLVPDPSFAKQ
jgi:membrane-associated progesterone receptor component